MWQDLRVSPVWGKHGLSFPNRPIFVLVKKGLCTTQAFKGKMAPILEPQNSVHPRFCQDPNLSRVGPPRVGRRELVNLLWGGSASQAWGKEGGVVPTLEPHNSVCPEFCPNLSVAEPPGVRRMGLPETRRMGLADLHWWWGTNQVRGKVGEWSPPQSHTTQSLTHTELTQTSTAWLRQLTPQQGHKFHRMGWQGVQRGELLHSCKLMSCGRKCSTQERRHLQCQRVAQHSYPAGCPFISLPRATNPRLSSHDSSPLYPNFAQAQGEWLWMRFWTLAR